jgi:hypothetical protein
MKSTSAVVAITALAAVASIPSATAGKHRMKLHKMPITSSANSQTILNNLQSQTAWVSQKYFGVDETASEKKLRYGHALKQPKEGEDVSIQMIEEAELASAGHEVPLSSQYKKPPAYHYSPPLLIISTFVIRLLECPVLLRNQSRYSPSILQSRP